MNRVVALLLAAALATPALGAEQVVDVPTRDGVTTSYLLVSEGSSPRYVLVSFVGSLGAMRLAARSSAGPLRFGPTANFLVRARTDFVDRDFADALVDAPSDQLPGGMSDAFRRSDMHVADIRAVLADLHKRFPGAKFYLIGTSRGTISAAALGAALATAIDGVVLTSAVTVPDRTGPGLSTFDFATLKGPVLLVHHIDDGCRSSPYSGAQALARRFPLISVHGGDAPRSGPCDAASQHGYFGVEAPTVAAIKAWIDGRDYPRQVP